MHEEEGTTGCRSPSNVHGTATGRPTSDGVFSRRWHGLAETESWDETTRPRPSRGRLLNMDWFKLYGKVRTDPKLNMRPVADRWAWICVLCLANEGADEDRGKINLRDDEIAFAVYLDADAWKSFRDYLVERGMLTGTDGAYEVAKWTELQGKGMTSTQRSRKHRGRQEDVSSADGNDDATSPQRPRNVPATESNALEERRGEKIEEKGQGQRQEHAHPSNGKYTNADAEAIYGEYPRKVGKRAATKAILKALAEIHERGIEDPVEWMRKRVATFGESPAGNCGSFVPHPASWFNAGRYDDDDSEWDRERSQATQQPASPNQYGITVTPPPS